jgi:hypothetical protein
MHAGHVFSVMHTISLVICTGKDRQDVCSWHAGSVFPEMQYCHLYSYRLHNVHVGYVLYRYLLSLMCSTCLWNTWPLLSPSNCKVIMVHMVKGRHYTAHKVMPQWNLRLTLDLDSDMSRCFNHRDELDCTVLVSRASSLWIRHAYESFRCQDLEMWRFLCSQQQ